ncbi:MAG: PQQ-binding-like beta-propeller repeat protein [Pirellulales bacterium]|nr:PQQ-binding-like beta-propeller repeat protein [Pirellulales bacterium]
MKRPAWLPLLLLLASSAHAANWPHWRGPFFNGSTDEKDLPAQFSKTENVAWSAALPGAAAATPIVWEDRVLLAGVDTQRDMLEARCLSRADGKLLWQHDIARGIRRDHRSNFASNSPVTDGEVVVFFFGNGDLACFDLGGNRLWSRNIQKDFGEFAFLWSFSASPTLYDGKLYVQVLQRNVPVQGRGLADRENESYLLALDPKTGKTLWRHVRPSDAVAESREAFSTPIPFVFEGREELLILGGDAITGHDPRTGKELWRWGDWNPRRIEHWRLVPSPVAGDGVVLACAPKRGPVYAVAAGSSGALERKAVAWETDSASKVSADVPTPAFYDGDFFILNDIQRTLSRIEARGGTVKWQLSTPGRGKYEASPLAADGKVYLVDFFGEVAVVDAKSGQLIHKAAMDDPADDEVVRASVVAAHGQLLVRTTRRLYCIGKGP